MIYIYFYFNQLKKKINQMKMKNLLDGIVKLASNNQFL